MGKTNLKEIFEPECKYGAFYTGGNIQWTADGYLLCQNGGIVSVLSLDKGSVTLSLGQIESDQAEDTINTFILDDHNVNVITHHKSGLFKMWEWRTNKLVKLWKSIHNGPVVQMALTNIYVTMASGGTDGTVRLWDLLNHACTHNLKGVQGVVSVLKFHPNAERKLLFGAGDDTKIHVWDTTSGREKVTLSGHFSRVTSLSFHKDGNYVVSSGRDSVLILWDISSGTSVRVVPVYQGIEGAFIIDAETPLPPFVQERNTDDLYVAAAGEKGTVNIWDMKMGREMYRQENSLVQTAKERGDLSIIHLLYNKSSNEFAVVTVDHNIIIHSLQSYKCKKQLVGYTDEILDVVYLGADDTHIAVATNSCDIKLYHISSMNCQLLSGHTGIVLALAATPANPSLFISSAKDHSVRVWLLDEETTRVSCIGSSVGHTASVGSVAISQTSTVFFVSVSQDLCLKLWKLSDNLKSQDQHLPLDVSHTALAHQKDINCVTVSPNDKLIATASQDKTAKLWSAKNLQLLGVFNGHRRGIWCVRFSPVDQVLLTTSADTTIKLWSLSDLNCLKTLEGYESSVLRGEFLSCGMQLITAGGDGLLKLWNIKTSECVCTLDQHESRVWTLAVTRNQKHVVSGDDSSLLVIWKDVTEEKREKEELEKLLRVRNEQLLMNQLQAGELHSALILALKLERPHQVFKIAEALLKKGNDELLNSVKTLDADFKKTVLEYAVTWNTNSRNSHVAQVIMSALITEIGAKQLQASGLSSTLEAVIPYTDRHFKRLTTLLQDLHLLTYTVNRMKPDIA